MRTHLCADCGKFFDYFRGHWCTARPNYEPNPPGAKAVATVPGSDSVNKPKHYTSDPSGVECITITRHRNFNIGNAFKYLWRAGLKTSAALDAKAKEIEDLHKAVWYLQDEIKRLEAA